MLRICWSGYYIMRRSLISYRSSDISLKNRILKLYMKLKYKILIYYLHSTVMYCEGFFIVNKSKKMPPIKRFYSKESQENTQVK